MAARHGNVDIRSFQLNDEVSLLLYDTAAAALRAIHDRYIAQSDVLVLDAWRQRSSLQKLGENAARLVSPLL